MRKLFFKLFFVSLLVFFLYQTVKQKNIWICMDISYIIIIFNIYVYIYIYIYSYMKNFLPEKNKNKYRI